MITRWICLVGLALAAFDTHAQGITAVTRRTFMAGVVGGFGAGPQAAAGGIGGIGVPSPQPGAAAATLLPGTALGSVPAPARVPPVPVGAVPVPESAEAREARQASASAAVLAFQQEQARKGLPSAQLALGRRYLEGDGLPRNPALARVWLEAAERGGLQEARPLLDRLPARSSEPAERSTRP